MSKFDDRIDIRIDSETKKKLGKKVFSISSFLRSKIEEALSERSNIDFGSYTPKDNRYFKNCIGVRTQDDEFFVY